MTPYHFEEVSFTDAIKRLDSRIDEVERSIAVILFILFCEIVGFVGWIYSAG